MRGLQALVVALAGLYVAWLLWGVFKPLRNDDVLWSYTGLAIVQRGLPRVLYGLGQVHLGLWHPPLFQYENALFFKLFGFSELTARLPGLLGVALCWGMGVAWLRRKGLGDRVWVFTLGLLLGVPLTQSALVPDIDGSLLAPVMLGLVWGLDEALQGGGWRSWSLLAGLSALALACKWTTPPVLFGFWLALILLWPAWRPAFFRWISALALGSLLFLVAFLGWCIWSRVSPFYPVEFSFLNKAASGAQGLLLRARLLSLFYGVTAAAGPGILAAVAGAWAARSPRSEGRLAGFLLLSGACLILAYSLVFPGFTPMGLTFKYLAPAAVFFALGLALLWDGSLPGLSPVWLAVFVALLLLLPLIYAVAEPLHQESPRRLGLGWLLLVGVAVPLCRRGRLGSWAVAVREAGLAVACLQAALFYGLALREPVDSSPSYTTIERGFAELVRHPPEGLRGRVLLASKDVTFYLSPEKGIPASPWFSPPPHGLVVALSERPAARRFAAWWPFAVDDPLYYPSFEQAFIKDEAGMRALLQGPVEAVADSDVCSFLTPDLRALVQARFPRQAHVGHYSVYQR